MPTSSYMPDVKVEIAWDSNWITPAGDRTWTDVSEYVELAEGLSIVLGRQDERSTADANQLTLTLDNSDGRFTAGLSSSPYYPNVRLGRPVRVTADPVDGDESVRFFGFLDELPVEWSDDTDATAYVRVTATSRLARLGGAAGLLSIVEETILTDGPVAYYTLGEPEGSTQANDSSGNGAGPLALQGDPALPVMFGNATGPGTDGLTAATFAGGQYLKGPGPGSISGITVECFFAISDPTSEGYLVAALQNGVGPVAGIYVAAPGFLHGFANTSLDLSYATSVNDDAIHHAALTWSGTSAALYVDGVSVATGSTSGSPSANELYLGYLNLKGTAAHVAVYDTALTGTQIAAHAAAGLNGFSGELTSERLERYAALAGIPAGEVSTETGQTAVSHIDTTDKTAVELMRECETTEGGVLFDAPDGTLTMHNRAHRYAAISAYTLTMDGDQEVEAGYSPKLDRTGLINDATAQNGDGTVTARRVDTDSRDSYGRATASVTTYSTDPNQPANVVGWKVYAGKDPKERAPQLAVNTLAQAGKTVGCAAIMATTLGDKITVAGRPSQAATEDVDYFVEGYTETYGPESLTFVFNVSPAAPYDEVLVIGDATRGVIGTNPVAF